MPLTPIEQKFILHWGEMGTRWGINRTVAQVHALLFVSPRPLHAEEIANTLAVARSNVSTSLRELQGWGIVRVAHVLGDRRDYLDWMRAVWGRFRIILEERKRREVDPTLNVLRDCVATVEKARPVDAEAKQRLGDLLEFMDTMDSAYREFRTLSISDLRRFLKLRGGMRRVASLIL